MSAQVVTRFAPSPTGFLHIGGARTALFSYLFAKNKGGKFLLRIEDTDKERSTSEAVEAIIDSLNWLGLDYDGEPYMQSAHADRHAEVAHELLAAGHAYKCFTSPEELAALREAAQKEGQKFRFQSPWRDFGRDTPDNEHPDDPYVIRLKMPQEGATTLADKVQGDVTIENTELDDMIILRSDGTPTYNLSVVVDDHDMGVTHIIRGDDHLINAVRQLHIYQMMGWDLPTFAHVPLIHGSDGAKLSKRHGALGAQEYKAMGYLPEAMNNYLLRLGWSHGDDEIIPMEKAIEWFYLEGLGKSPSRLDMDKLNAVNAHYVREMAADTLMMHLEPFLLKEVDEISDQARGWIVALLPDLSERAQTLVALAHAARFLAQSPTDMDDEKAQNMISEADESMIADLKDIFEQASQWQHEALFEAVKSYAASKELKVGKVAGLVRAITTGMSQGPSVFKILEVFGKEETLHRF